VTRKLGMGSTGILFEALKSGAIDVYPDYTGTLAEAILKQPDLKSLEEIREALGALDLTISGSLGFNDTYALAVKESFAEQHQLHAIGDLIPIQSGVRAAFSYEFMDRKDGYPGLVDNYHLAFDRKSQPHGALLELSGHRSERGGFDRCVFDGRKDQETASAAAQGRSQLFPGVSGGVGGEEVLRREASARMAGAVGLGRPDQRNGHARYECAGRHSEISFDKIAAQFLGAEARSSEGWWQEVARRTREHLWLVGVSLLFSVLVGIPLGIAAVRFHATGQAILLSSAVIQTVPSLALLCFLIPVFGVGTKPALAALCLYSLLPVVLNTFTGIRAVNPIHLENARAFGLNRRQVLLRVVLPLASPTLLAGIKTATIVSIGTATLAALVGAGGYGAPIVSGLALNDVHTILTGAIPAALMALVAHGIFELLGVVLIPAGLRRRS
jgi:osmoprotectant transport system permease protein